MPLIDVLLGSKELKRELVKRSFEFEIPFKLICQDIGVDYKMFMSTYINASEGDATHINEGQFKDLMAMLGMEVRYQFVINKNFNYEEVKNRLQDKENEKKGIITKIG